VSFLCKWADAIDKLMKPIARVGIYIAMVSLFLMVLFIVVDVVTRHLFDIGLPGVRDLQEFLLCFITFLGLPWVTYTFYHVKVDLIVDKFPKWTQSVTDNFTSVLGLIVWALIAMQTIRWALRIVGTGLEATVLDIPIYPFVFAAGVGCAITCIIIISQIFRFLDSGINEGGKKGYYAFLGLALAGGLVWGSINVELPFSSLVIGGLGIVLLMVLLFMRMPIAFTMAFIGIIGTWNLVGFEPGLALLMNRPYYQGTFFYAVVIPFFFLMGSFTFHAGISRELYETAYAWVGHLPGGLASATVGGCAGFAAICGDSLATAAAMGTVSLPEMQRFKYDNSLACGCVAAGGTLGILIPPSMGFIFYSIVTEVSISTLFIAGIIPGICLASLFIIYITIHASMNKKLGPPGPSTAWKRKIVELRKVWPVVALFSVVIGGIYMGIFTVIEAGGIGAVGAFLLIIIKRKFTWSTALEALHDSTKISSMLMVTLIGVMVLGYFLGASKLPLVLAEFISALPVGPYVILTLVLLVYVVLGMLMNIIPMILLTLPVFWPTICILGFDGVWFGVVMVIMMEMGQITPPIGMNVFVIAGVAKDVPMGQIFKGIWPFVACEVIFIVILTIFPQIALWLPKTMGMWHPG